MILKRITNVFPWIFYTSFNWLHSWPMNHKSICTKCFIGSHLFMPYYQPISALGNSNNLRNMAWWNSRNPQKCHTMLHYLNQIHASQRPVCNCFLEIVYNVGVCVCVCVCVCLYPYVCVYVCGGHWYLCVYVNPQDHSCERILYDKLNKF